MKMKKHVAHIVAHIDHGGMSFPATIFVAI